MTAVAVFLFVIGLVGFASGEVIPSKPIAGPITFKLKFDGYTNGDDGETEGSAPVLVIGKYDWKTITFPQSSFLHNSIFENTLSGTLQHTLIYDWAGALTDVYIDHIILGAPSKEATHVDMRGKKTFSGLDNAGQNVVIDSEYPKTTIVNNVLVGVAATRLVVNVDPYNAYSIASYENRSVP